MPLVFGAITPHGDIVPGTPGAARAAATTAAMEEIGRRLEAARPEVVVVVSPHGIRVDGAVAVAHAERAEGTLEDPDAADGAGWPLRVGLDVDVSLARAILAGAAAAGVPAVAVHYGATSGPHDCYPLDWGALVPLWFLGARFARPPRAVLAVPSRALPLEALVRFGRAVAGAAAGAGRVALVASADLAHAHAADGPYGFDPAASRFDAWIEAAVRDGALGRLLDADMELVERACPDGLWQILVLAGALEIAPLAGEFLSYERPTYYGMLTAAYAPAAERG